MDGIQIGRMQWIAPGKTHSSPWDPLILQIGNDLVGYGIGKQVTRVDTPGALVIATATLVLATGHKQGAACPWAIDHIDRKVVVIVHL